jgi:hypothetical protein
VAAVTLVVLAPLAWLANRQAGRRDATIFTPNWTSVVLQFRVKKKPEAARLRPLADVPPPNASRKVPMQERL